jgi:hypothetical protein
VDLRRQDAPYLGDVMSHTYIHCLMYVTYTGNINSGNCGNINSGNCADINSGNCADINSGNCADIKW